MYCPPMGALIREKEEKSLLIRRIIKGKYK